MEDSILKFNKQFNYEPEVENAEYLGDFDHIVLCGMGGSHLAADLIKTIKPGIDIYVHRDYDLPPFEEDFLKRGLLIACSYSGNTEETLSFFEKAQEKELKTAVISAGGKLLDLAIENNIPYIQIPDTGIQPRQADGFFALAILKIMGDEETVLEWSLLSERLKPESLREEGLKLAKEIQNKIPVIYSSTKNVFVAYNWKITMNETAKIPAFYNIFPELNHNEMQGFDFKGNQENSFHVVFLIDNMDNSQIQKRMKITRDLYEERGITTSLVKMGNQNIEEKIFNAIILADWVALEIANLTEKEAEPVPLIEEFKKRLASN